MYVFFILCCFVAVKNKYSHVMQMLGHRNINNTLRFTQLIKTEDDEFISKVANTVEDACKLVEAGYKYVTEFQDKGMKIFRKRK